MILKKKKQSFGPVIVRIYLIPASHDSVLHKGWVTQCILLFFKQTFASKWEEVKPNILLQLTRIRGGVGGEGEGVELNLYGKQKNKRVRAQFTCTGGPILPVQEPRKTTVAMEGIAVDQDPVTA